jgi:hypothetical protein
LDGGSLIEAALDDIVLYDVVPLVDDVTNLVALSSLKVSPNPSSHTIYIEGSFANTPVQIFDMKGSLIYEGKTRSTGDLSLDVSSFSAGFYNIQLRDVNAVRSALRFEVL